MLPVLEALILAPKLTQSSGRFSHHSVLAEICALRTYKERMKETNVHEEANSARNPAKKPG